MSNDGKISDVCRMLFNTLLVIVNRLVMIFAGEIDEDIASQNSCIPSSHTT